MRAWAPDDPDRLRFRVTHRMVPSERRDAIASSPWPTSKAMRRRFRETMRAPPDDLRAAREYLLQVSMIANLRQAARLA
jgi:hypothetical protein